MGFLKGYISRATLLVCVRVDWGQLREIRDEHLSLARPRGAPWAAFCTHIVCAFPMTNKQEGIKMPDWMRDPKQLCSHYVVINYPAASHEVFGP